MSARDEFIKLLTQSMRNNGLDELPSKLVAILYISPEPVSLESLAEETKYSLSAVSTAMKFMTQLGMVKTTKKPKSRKIYYYFEKDLITFTLELAKKKRDLNIRPTLEKLPKILKKYKKSKMPRAKKELEIAQTYYTQTKHLETVLTKTIQNLEKIHQGDYK